MYHILFDGSITDYRQYAAIGGHAEVVNGFLKEQYKDNMPLREALALCRRSLERTSDNKTLKAEQLEVAVLDRTLEGRKFRRLQLQEIRQCLELT